MPLLLDFFSLRRSALATSRAAPFLRPTSGSAAPSRCVANTQHPFPPFPNSVPGLLKSQFCVVSNWRTQVDVPNRATLQENVPLTTALDVRSRGIAASLVFLSVLRRSDLLPTFLLLRMQRSRPRTRSGPRPNLMRRSLRALAPPTRKVGFGQWLC